MRAPTITRPLFVVAANLGLATVLTGCALFSSLGSRDRPTDAADSAPPPAAEPEDDWATIIEIGSQPRGDELEQNRTKAQQQLEALRADPADESPELPLELRINRIRSYLAGTHRTDYKEQAAAIWEQVEPYAAKLPPNAGPTNEYRRRDFRQLLAQCDGLFGRLQSFPRAGFGTLPMDEATLDKDLAQLATSLEDYERQLARDQPEQPSERARAAVAATTAYAEQKRTEIVDFHTHRQGAIDAKFSDKEWLRLSSKADRLTAEVDQRSRVLGKSVREACAIGSSQTSADKKLCALSKKADDAVRKKDERGVKVRDAYYESVGAKNPWS